MVNPFEFGARMHSVFRNQHALVLVADQSPALPTSGYWISFFNRPTIFIPDPEKSAIRNNVAVVAYGFKKLKRGRYHFEERLITRNAAELTARGEIIRLYRDILQTSIREDPANYLWSHRRFKFEWQPEFGKKIE